MSHNEEDFPKTTRMVMYTRGKEVYYRGNRYIVDHVMLKRYNLLIKLEGIDGAVPSEHVWAEPTVLDLTRQPR